MAVAFSPDGTRLATGSAEGQLRVRDRATGRLLLTVQAHKRLLLTGGVSGLAFRPDGKEIASASGDGSVKLWDAATGRLLRTLLERANDLNPRSNLCYSPDGTRLAVRTKLKLNDKDSTVRVLETSTGREVFSRSSPAGCSGLAFSPDGRQLAIAGDPGRSELASIVDLATGRPVVTLRGHSRSIVDLAWSGDRLATLGNDATVKVWDAATGEPKLTWRPDSDGIGFAGGVLAFRPRPSGSPERLAVVTQTGQGTVRELTEGKEVLAFSCAQPPLAFVAFSPDGQYLLTPGNTWDAVAVRDGASEPLALTLRDQHETGTLTAVAFSPDGQLLAGGSTRASLWDAATGEEFPPLPPFPGAIRALAFSPDSRLLIAATTVSTRPADPGEVKVWEVAGRKEVLTFQEHTAPIHDVAISPDSRRVASASDDRTVKVWDALTGKVELTLKSEKAGFVGVAFSPDGARLAAVSSDRLIRVWNTDSGRQLAVFGRSAPGNDFGNKIAFSPDGKYLVAGGQAVTVWDAATGTEVRTLEGSPGDASRVAFSHDGKLLAAAGNDGVVVWDFASGHEVLSYPARGNLIFGLAFSPDGSRLAVGDGENLDVWEVGEQWQGLAAAQRRDARERLKAWHTQQGERQGQWFAVHFHRSCLIALEPDQGAHYALRADANVELGRWDEAAADAARAVELRPDSSQTWHRQALLHLRASNVPQYRQTCEALLKRLDQTTDPATANAVAWTCCLAPDATGDPKSIVALAERAVAKGADSNNLGTLGAALYRAGRHAETVTRLREAIKAHEAGGHPADWFFLAMAHHHLNQPDQAREALQQGRAQQKKHPPPNWGLRLVVDLLRAEAEKLIEEKKP
jgi:WD40 repeat protein